MTYISWFIDIGLYLEDSVMYKAVTLAGGIHEPLLTCSSDKRIPCRMFISATEIFYITREQGNMKTKIFSKIRI